MRVIAINDSYRLAPWCDALYFADFRWWQWHHARPEFSAVEGVKVSIENTGQEIPDPDVFVLRNLSRDGPSGCVLSRTENGLITGQNSGYQAIGLGVLAGSTRIVLLGYDMGAAPDGRTHWFGDHPIRTPSAIWSCMVQEYERLAPELRRCGVEVLNASARTALRMFERVSLESLVADPVAAALPA